MMNFLPPPEDDNQSSESEYDNENDDMIAGLQDYPDVVEKTVKQTQATQEKETTWFVDNQAPKEEDATDNTEMLFTLKNQPPEEMTSNEVKMDFEKIGLSAQGRGGRNDPGVLGSQRPKTAVDRKTNDSMMRSTQEKGERFNKQDIEKEAEDLPPPPKETFKVAQPAIISRQQETEFAAKVAQKIDDDSDEFASSSDDMEDYETKMARIREEQIEEDKKAFKEAKQKFKPWFKPDYVKIKKTNFIGDQIIVEKLGSEEADVKDKIMEVEESKTTSKDGKLRDKVSKINQLYEETTKEFKQQQKEMGI